MHVELDGAEVFVHTGGVDPDLSEGYAIVLVHGAGNDHTVWRFQTRRLAAMGLPTLAVDLPGHGRSAGPPLTTVEDMADWLRRLLDHLGVRRASVVGHSMGSLIALQCAAADPQRVVQIGLVATAATMGVHPELLALADAQDPKAIDLIVGWQQTGSARLGGHPQAGSWFTGLGRRLLEQNLAPLGTDLHAVVAYPAGEVAVGLDVDAVVIAFEKDRMTPAKAGLALADALSCPVHVVPDGSHSFVDHPNEVNAVLLPWLAAAARDPARA